MSTMSFTKTLSLKLLLLSCTVLYTVFEFLPVNYTHWRALGTIAHI